MISCALIRHGATNGNLEKRYIGRTDEPLCSIGMEQALKLRGYKLPKEHIFISPMKRTIQTAELIFPESKYVIEENFRETDFGIFEGKTALELSENEAYKIWVASMCTSAIPGGESIAEFKKRCVTAFWKIIKALPERAEASFVLHGGVIMTILESFAGTKGNFYDYHIKNGEFIVCNFEQNTISYRNK